MVLAEQIQVPLVSLLQMIFGVKSEKAESLIDDKEKDDTPSGDTENKKPKGHGRNGADAYEGASKIFINSVVIRSLETILMRLRYLAMA